MAKMSAPVSIWTMAGYLVQSRAIFWADAVPAKSNNAHAANLRLTVYRLGAKPTVSVAITLRPGSSVRRSPPLGVKGAAEVPLIAGEIPVMLWLSKRLLTAKPSLLPLRNDEFFTV